MWCAFIQRRGQRSAGRVSSIEEAYSLVAHAALTIGVDTGLTHFAAVLGKPTIEIYCDSPRWKTEGYWSSNIANLGDRKNPPSIEELKVATKRQLIPQI
jgi:heptosyltransferase-1